MRWTLTAARAREPRAHRRPHPPRRAPSRRQNACLWSFDGFWRDQAVDLTGTGAPTPVAPGSGLALTRAVGPRAAARLGRRDRREHRDCSSPARTRSRRRSGSRSPADGTLAGRAGHARSRRPSRTTVTEHAGRHATPSTPIDVTIPMPDTAWTAGGRRRVALPPGRPRHAADRSPAATAGANVTPQGQRVHLAPRSAAARRSSSTASPAPREGGHVVHAARPPAPFETVADPGRRDRDPRARGQDARCVSLRTTKLRAPASASPRAGLRRRAVQGRGDARRRRHARARSTYSLARGRAQDGQAHAVGQGRAKLARRSSPARARQGHDRRRQDRVEEAEAEVKRALLAALCAALLIPATADAAAKRVVAIEWDTVENLHMLGMAPVGAADMKGYDTWVAAPRPRGMKDVGSRQSPSLERIAALKPDLIVVPDYRSTKNLSQLKRIAPVLVTHPYPASGSQFDGDGHRLPAARRRRRPRQPRASACCRTSATRSRATRRSSGARARRAPRWRSPRPAARPARPRSACSPRTRRPPTSSAGSGCATAGAGRARYGFATIGLEGLSRVSGWLAFVYPPQFAAPGLGHHAPDRVQAAAGREGQARADARRDDMAVRRPALDDAVRRPA